MSVEIDSGQYNELTNRALGDADIEVYVDLKSVLGHFAMYAVRQSPYVVPDNLAEAVTLLRDELRPHFDANGLLRIGAHALRRLLLDSIVGIRCVELWNLPKEGSHEFVFVSRYGQPDPDHDFIDLDALCRNVTFGVVREVVVEDGVV